MATDGNIEPAATAKIALGADIASGEIGRTGSKFASMVEQVAAAIFLSERPGFSWEAAMCKAPYRDMARAAITSVGTPSEEAKLAGARSLRDTGMTDNYLKRADLCFRAMLKS